MAGLCPNGIIRSSSSFRSFGKAQAPNLVTSNNPTSPFSHWTSQGVWERTKKATGDEERWDGAARRWVLHGRRGEVWCGVSFVGEREAWREIGAAECQCAAGRPKARVHSEGKAKELGQATRPQSLISRGATHRRSNQHQHLDTGARCRPGGRRQRQKGDFVAVPAPCGNESQHKHEPLFPSRPLSLHSRPTRQTCTSQPGQSGRNRRPDDGLTAHAWKSRLPDAVRLDAESKKHL